MLELITKEEANENVVEYNKLENYTVVPDELLKYISDAISNASKNGHTRYTFTSTELEDLSMKWDSEHIDPDERWNLHNLRGIEYRPGYVTETKKFLFIKINKVRPITREYTIKLVDRFGARVRVIKAMASMFEEKGFSVITDHHYKDCYGLGYRMVVDWS